MKTRAGIPLIVSLRRERGFSLLEVMAAVTVLAVLLGIGVPAFTDTTRNNQIAAASANMVSALTLARSEAMKRGTRVSVCAAADPDTCSEGTDWSNGWIVFSDDFGAAGVMDEADSPLQVWEAPAAGVTVKAGDAVSVSFTRRARAEFAQTFTVSKYGCSGNQERVVDITISGRVGLTRQDCT